MSVAAEKDPEAAFKDFMTRFGKRYESEQEQRVRFSIFRANFLYILRENSNGANAYVLGVNEFTDQSPEEFAAKHYGYARAAESWGSLPHLGTHKPSNGTLPDSVDWTTKGAVTPVKNQGQCGSCWAFSTTGALEGAWEVKTGKLISLSEQQFVDCSKDNDGCGGGSMDAAFQYAEQNAICTEASYRYTAQGGKCRADNCTVGIKKGGVTGFKDVAKDSEQALMSAVAQQPVSIAVEADKPVFQSYTSGVMTGVCGANLDHGILVVGYGTENGQKYWKVKNSWGSSWGEQGYGKLLRGKSGAGECGILSDASYPVVSDTEDTLVV